MKKAIVYFHYFMEYFKFRDIYSIFSSLMYLFFRKSHHFDRTIETRMGKFYCRKNTNDFQFASFAYERSVKKFILKEIENVDVFFDAGACIGDYSIFLSKSGLRCFAFEPVPASFDVLKRNIELNNATSLIQAFPYGLGEKNQTANFFFNPINTGNSHIDRLQLTGNCIVQIRTLDSVFRSFGLSENDRILFKLDVEGMEKEALKGAMEFITYFDNLIFITESTHTPESVIRETLDQIALFEYGTVDDYNMFARKKSGLTIENSAA